MVSGVTVGDMGLCCCVPRLSNAIISLCLVIVPKCIMIGKYISRTRWRCFSSCCSHVQLRPNFSHVLNKVTTRIFQKGAEKGSKVKQGEEEGPLSQKRKSCVERTGSDLEVGCRGQPLNDARVVKQAVGPIAYCHQLARLHVDVHTVAVTSIRQT